MTILAPKIKWVIPPVNTKGAEIQSATLCSINNILTTIRCKSCGNPRAVYVVGGGSKLKGDDRELVQEFLENQSSTYTCASINFLVPSVDKRKIDKRSYRPYIPTYIGNLALCCMHPIEEKVYKFDMHQKTCYVCGDNSNEDTVINQFPLCKNCSDNKWPNKSFTIIAKRKSNKKAKINNSDDNNENAVDNNNAELDLPVIHDNDYNTDVNDVNLDAEVDLDEEDVSEDIDEEEDLVTTDLVVGSKKRNARSKKTNNSNFVCEADKEFTAMHGPGDFSSLICNSFKNSLTVEDNKAKNKKKK